MLTKIIKEENCACILVLILVLAFAPLIGSSQTFDRKTQLENFLKTKVVYFEDLEKLKSANIDDESVKYKRAIYDPYSQSDIHVKNGKNKFDYQSSGDVDNDGDRDMDDVNLINQEIANPGTLTKEQKKRANLNGDFFVVEKDPFYPVYDRSEKRDTITQEDANILYEFVTAKRDHLPGYINKLNFQEKIEWMIPRIKANTFFPIFYNNSGYLCQDYSKRFQLNFMGVEDFENWTGFPIFENYAENAKENIPVYGAITTTVDGVLHAIPVFFVGPENSNISLNIKDINQWYFFDYKGYTKDGQGNKKDTIKIVPGDHSINPNELVEIVGFTKTEDGSYIGTTITEWQLNDSIATNTYTSPYILKENPNTTTLTHAPYPDTLKIDISEPIPNLNFDYISNTINYQDSIKQKKTISPAVKLNELESEVIVEDVLSMTMGRWTKSDTARTIVQYVDIKPADIKAPIDTIVGYTINNENITPELLGYATATDNSGYDVDISYRDSLIEETPSFKYYARIWDAEDWKGNVSTATQDIKMDKSVSSTSIKGLEDKISYNYPDPSHDYTTLPYTLKKESNVDILIYDMSGRQVYQQKVQGKKGNNEERINISNLAPGNYIFKIFVGSEYYGAEKFFKDRQ